jgi:hypothetical protein
MRWGSIRGRKEGREEGREEGRKGGRTIFFNCARHFMELTQEEN